MAEAGEAGVGETQAEGGETQAEVVLDLPLPLNLANARLHWAQMHRAKGRYYAQCDAMQGAGLIPAPPAEPWQRATASAHFRTWNRLDVDNMVARLKWALDWAVTRGYLVDDRPEHLRLEMPTQEIDRAQQGLTLTLRMAL